MNQFGQDKLLAGSILSSGITEVSQTAKASMILTEKKIAMKEVGKNSENKRYFAELRQCLNCTTNKTDDSKLFLDEAKYGVSMFRVRVD